MIIFVYVPPQLPTAQSQPTVQIKLTSFLSQWLLVNQPGADDTSSPQKEPAQLILLCKLLLVAWLLCSHQEVKHGKERRYHSKKEIRCPHAVSFIDDLSSTQGGSLLNSVSMFFMP